MRLLHVDNLEFTEFRSADIPKYVTASHRWANGFEANFKDVLKRRNANERGLEKVEGFAQYIRAHIPHVKWLWLDTCCIDQTNAVELSEAVNLMFDWYRNAELCIAYLADVERTDDKSSFDRSEWFERGWTLQELLAPRTVVFVTKAWQVIGHKGGSAYSSDESLIGPCLEGEIAKITGIPELVLHDYETSIDLPVHERLKWMDSRRTSREEDMSYALYGIFSVTPGANYGEKGEGARERLLNAIYQRKNSTAQGSDQFRRIADWLAPSDPWTNHASARQRHEPQTGAWLLGSEQYWRWKAGTTRHLWLPGKPGCGKTILCSSAIEDIRAHCTSMRNTGCAIFYFSFSDTRKQSYGDLICSLTAQLGWREPGMSILRQTYDRPSRNMPRPVELEGILLSTIRAYDEIFLLLDALDECPNGEMRQGVLQYLERLAQRAGNVKMFATSRELIDIEAFTKRIGMDRADVATQSVENDILRYVSKEMLRDPRLGRLSATAKALIEETISKKADGM